MTGIILETAVPVRTEPSDKAEMVNQLIFGETYKVEELANNWLKIVSMHDSYPGWIDKKQHTDLKEKMVNTDVVYEECFIQHKARGQVRVSAGSFLPSKEILHSFGFNDSEQRSKTELSIKNLYPKFMNAPYLWGGRTHFGIDCSGFTQLVYRMMGKSIPRDASQQVELGKQVSFVEEAMDGDLAFFDNSEGKITHVGIIINTEERKTIVHASGRVRLDKIDHQGIYNAELKEYSHQLRTIKTIL